MGVFHRSSVELQGSSPPPEMDAIEEVDERDTSALNLLRPTCDQGPSLRPIPNAAPHGSSSSGPKVVTVASSHPTSLHGGSPTAGASSSPVFGYSQYLAELSSAAALALPQLKRQAFGESAVQSTPSQPRSLTLTGVQASSSSKWSRKVSVQVAEMGLCSRENSATSAAGGGEKPPRAGKFGRRSKPLAQKAVEFVDPEGLCCAVCLDEGDFVAMRPCNHRICGEWQPPMCVVICAWL